MRQCNAVKLLSNWRAGDFSWVTSRCERGWVHIGRHRDREGRKWFGRVG